MNRAFRNQRKIKKGAVVSTPQTVWAEPYSVRTIVVGKLRKAQLVKKPGSKPVRLNVEECAEALKVDPRAISKLKFPRGTTAVPPD